jgi:5-methylcytosine-specific restriction endonuclease McrA
MAKDYAKDFYRSKAWHDCRDGYIKKVSGLCERCLAKGLYRPGVIVHHKIYLTPRNIKDPSISLNWDNLELLCRECHNEEHLAKDNKRYHFDKSGNLIINRDKVV